MSIAASTPITDPTLDPIHTATETKTEIKTDETKSYPIISPNNPSLWRTIVDLNIFYLYRGKNLLRVGNHNHLPLTIWNYEEIVQIKPKLWDHITIMCRGLIVETTTGNIVGRSFPKFWNDYENRHTITSTYDVYEKMDGSLGILFYYANEWIIASRGSFHSEQAIHAKQMLSQYDLSHLNPQHSYIFEIIYPTNRIVVNYGEREELVFLAAYDNTNGEEIYPPPCDIMKNCKFPIVKSITVDPSATTLEQLKQLNLPNSEGFVIRFSNGSRCKIKFETYLTLHKFAYKINQKTIFDMYASSMDEGRKIAFLTAIPDEFQDYVERQWNMIESRYNTLHTELLNLTQDLMNKHTDRKSFAIAIKDHPNKSILFLPYIKPPNWEQKMFNLICNAIKPMCIKEEKEKEESVDKEDKLKEKEESGGEVTEKENPVSTLASNLEAVIITSSPVVIREASLE